MLIERPWAAFPAVFAAGVLTSATPCVYPMIPVTAAIVGGQRSESGATTRGSAALTLAYVGGLAAVYAALGTLAGYTGSGP